MDIYLRQCRHITDITAMQSSDIPLFIDEQGKTFMRDKFISYVKQVLHRIGCDEDKYCGHSFRIGAATSAAAANIEDHMIQTLGRWSSSCYTRYIRVQPLHIKAAQERMCQ